MPENHLPIPIQQLKQVQQAIEHFFYKNRVNLVLDKVVKSRKTTNFKKKVKDSLYNQILYFAKVEKVDQIVGVSGLGKAVKFLTEKDLLERLETLWVPLYSFLDEEDVHDYILWAGEKGGQGALGKLRVQRDFELTNNKLRSSLTSLADTLTRQVDNTTKDWLARTIEQGFRGNLSHFEIAKLIRNSASAVALERSEVIAEQEAAIAVGEIEMEVYKRNGVREVRWVTQRTENTCLECLANEEAGVVKVGEVFPSGVVAPPLHPNCYSEDTEFLTDKGWKLIKLARVGDVAVTLIKDGCDLEYSPVIRTYKKFCEWALHFRNNQRSFDMLVSEDHPLFGYKRVDHGKGGRLVEPVYYNNINLVPKSEFKFYVSSRWKGQGRDFFEFGDLKIKSEDFCRFIGYYLSEGSISRHKSGLYEITISQIKYLSKMHEDIAKIPFRKVYLAKKGVYIRDDRIVNYLMGFGKSADKYVPQEIKLLSPSLIRIFLDAFLLGDGSIVKSRPYKGGKFKDAKSYFTSSKRLADDLCELLIKVGKSVSFSRDDVGGKLHRFGNGNYIIKNDLWRIHETNSQYRKMISITINKEAYNNFMYDVEVEKNNTILIRRKGKIYWGSNCACFLMPVVKEAQVVWTGG